MVRGGRGGRAPPRHSWSNLAGTAWVRPRVVGALLPQLWELIVLEGERVAIGASGTVAVVRKSNSRHGGGRSYRRPQINRGGLGQQEWRRANVGGHPEGSPNCLARVWRPRGPNPWVPGELASLPSMQTLCLPHRSVTTGPVASLEGCA